MSCEYLGGDAGFAVAIPCKARRAVRERARHCLHPDHRRTRKPGVCLARWVGPWREDQAIEAATIRLCWWCEVGT